MNYWRYRARISVHILSDTRGHRREGWIVLDHMQSLSLLLQAAALREDLTEGAEVHLLSLVRL